MTNTFPRNYDRGVTVEEISCPLLRQVAQSRRKAAGARASVYYGAALGLSSRRMA